MVPETGAFFFYRRITWNFIFLERYKRFVKLYVLRLIAVPLEARLIREAVKVRRHEAM